MNTKIEKELMERYQAFVKEAIFYYIKSMTDEALIRRLVPNLEVNFPALAHSKKPEICWGSLVESLTITDELDVLILHDKRALAIFKEQLDQLHRDIASAINNS